MLFHAAAGVVFCSLAFAQEPARPEASPTTQLQSGVRAGFWWADYDRDGLDDAFVVGADGAARLLRNSGDGSFADVTLISGLDGLGAASFAAWQDFDRDGAADVFVGTQSGPGHLMRNAGDGTFQDVTQFLGLTHSGRHLAAQWFDYDLDGLSDIAVRTDAGEHLYHALPNGHFEAVDLGSTKPSPILDATTNAGEIVALGGAAVSPPANVDHPVGHGLALPPPAGRTNAPVASPRLTPGPPSPPAGSYLVSACPPKITDSSNSSCLQASSVATLGMLYPLSINLNVSGAGNVGIGTTTPTAKLDVIGTARISDTLTLNPSGDQALDLSTGSLYKSGLLFAHTKGGLANTALGREALQSVTTGPSNTAVGYRALFSHLSGYRNTACGAQALRSNTSGGFNTACGADALLNNTIGNFNTATGREALRSNTTGTENTASGVGALRNNTFGRDNTASGVYALYSNTTGNSNTANGRFALAVNTTGIKNLACGSSALQSTTTGNRNTACGADALLLNTTGNGNTAIGYKALAANLTAVENVAIGIGALQNNSSGSRNVAIGRYAGTNLTTGNDNITISSPGAAGEGATIRIGSPATHTRAFIAGVRSVTTGSANTIPVLIDINGQLGTISSSRRFKKDIVDMGNATSRLLELRPVRFRYKQEQTMPDGSEVPMEYGLIAEEVAEILPDLVVYDEEGKPFTVKYHILSSMLLNELEKQARVNAEQQAELTHLRGLESRLAALEARASPSTSPTVAAANDR